MNNYYTYAYLREDRTPYYIGKGSGRRMFSSYDRTVHLPKDRKRIIILKQNLTEEEAFNHEKYMIAVFGRKDLGTGILRNRTDGGDGIPGYKHTDEFKRFNSLLHKGKTLSESQKQAISKAHKGISRTEEERIKISKGKEKYLYIVYSIKEEKYYETTNLKKFCDEKGMSNSHLYKTLNGKLHQHKGFRVITKAKSVSPGIYNECDKLLISIGS